MKLNLRDALQQIITNGGSPASPEWESQHLSDVVSTMDNIASASLTQMTSDRGDLRLAFQTLDNMEPQNEFQAAMAQYARASLQLLESLGGVSGTIYPETPSTLIPGLGGASTLTDESKVNLLQSLSEYTDSRVTMATYTSFPSTPFSDPNSLLRSLTLSETPVDTPSIASERLSISRPSMSSRHLGHRMSLINSSVLSTPVTYGAESEILPPSNYTYYEPLSEMSTECPSTVIAVRQPEKTVIEDETTYDQNDILQKVDPSESHDQNTALCKALALQALTDINVTPKSPTKRGFPKLRPLGGSSSFRYPKSPTKPSVQRRHSFNGDPFYMTYRVRPPLSTVSSTPHVPPPNLPAPHLPRNHPLPPRKPARQFSTKSSRRSCTTLDSVRALEKQQSLPLGASYSGHGNPGGALSSGSSSGSSSNDSYPSKRFSFMNKTRSLINRVRFGSKGHRKRESPRYRLKIDPTSNKSKTL